MTNERGMSGKVWRCSRLRLISGVRISTANGLVLVGELSKVEGRKLKLHRGQTIRIKFMSYPDLADHSVDGAILFT